MRALWPQAKVLDATLKVSIGEIRKVLGDHATQSKFIETVGTKGYRFIAPISLRLPEAGRESFVPFVGRTAELNRLQHHFELANAGKRQIVFVTGEPGIGKTTLVDAFTGHLAGNEDVLIAHGQCIEQYGAGEAYLPILDILDRLCRGADGQIIVDRLRHHAPSWLAHLPMHFSVEERAALERQSLGIAAERRLREIGTFLEDIAKDRPLLLVLEDLHWLDPSTLALLSFIARRREVARLILIGTYRPGEVERLNLPLKNLQQELEMHGYCHELAVPFLDQRAVGEYLSARFETPHISPELLTTVHGRSDGNPLFMVNITDYLVDRAAIMRESGSVSVSRNNEVERIPTTLSNLIDRQFELLDGSEQELLQTASVAGTTFSAAAIAGALDQAHSDVERCFQRLAARKHFVQYAGVRQAPTGKRTARYSFIHALYQNAIYQQVGETRRAHLHKAIAERIEGAYLGATETVAAELALHFERGGDYQRALPYLINSAGLAASHGSFQEALAYCRQGLGLAKRLDDGTQRTTMELSLQLLSGVCCASSSGYASAEASQAYSAARRLSRRLKRNDDLLFQSLAGLWSFHLIRGQLREALGLANNMLKLARRKKSHPLLVNGHMATGVAHFYLGRMHEASDHLKKASSFFDPQDQRPEASIYGWDSGVIVSCYRAQSQWLEHSCGNEVVEAESATQRADQLNIPFHRAFASGLNAIYHTYRSEPKAALTHAQAAINISAEYGIYHWLALGILLKGWSLATLGKSDEGLALLQEGIGKWRATGARMGLPTYLALQSEAQDRCGKTQEALETLEDALEIARRSGEHYYDGEIYRLKGEFLLHAKSRDHKKRTLEAETWMLRAVQVSRRRRLKAHEVRATVSLARLWQTTNNRQTAYQKLQKIYNSFSEGFDTPDLKQAKALLDELA